VFTRLHRGFAEEGMLRDTASVAGCDNGTGRAESQHGEWNVAFDVAFEELLRQPLRATGLDRAQIRAQARRGQLAADDDRVTALCASFL